MNVIQSILYFVAVLFAVIVAIKTKKGWLRWLFIFLIVAATVTMALLFKSWLIPIWTFLLSVIVFLIVKIKRAFWRFVLYLLLIVSLFLGVTSISKNTFTKSVFPSSCNEAISVASQVHGGKVEIDLNDGDQFDYSLTIVSPDVPQSKDTLVVLTEPGYIFDVVHPVMYFTSYRLQGTLDQALCSAGKIGGNAKTFVYVGTASTPQGWKTVSENGWWTELVAKKYTDKALTPGGDWTTFQIAVDDKNRTLKSENIVYGQLWNPKESGKVVHFQIENGYKLVIPDGWQGTYWTVSGADPVIVQDRLVQASQEVIQRDNLIPGNVYLLYCGAKLPSNELTVEKDTIKWQTSLNGWICD